MIGKEFKTLGDVETFTLLDIDEEFVHVRPHAGSHDRHILRTSFEAAWHRLKAGAVLERTALDAIQVHQGSYLAALIRHLPNVDWADQPVRVWLRRQVLQPVESRSAIRLVVANASSLAFHNRECRWARRIGRNNRITFDSSAEAVRNGYSPCHECDPGR